MEEVQDILLGSLESAGVALPSGVYSARGLSPDAVVSICAQSLHLIDPSALPLPAFLPAAAAERFKVCADIAAAVGSLGYRGELSFRQLLYPSDDESYKLLRFLVERLSESSEGSKNSGKKLMGDTFKADEATCQNIQDVLKQEMDVAEDGGGCLNSEAVVFRIRSPGGKELAESSEAVGLDVRLDIRTVPDEANESYSTGNLGSGQECHHSGKEQKELLHDSGMDSRCHTLDNNMMSRGNDEYSTKGMEKPAYLHKQLPKMENTPDADEMENKAEDQQSHEKLLMEDVHAKATELHDLEYELEFLKAVSEMASYDRHRTELYIDELKKGAEARRCNILELESQWHAFEKSFEERRVLLEQSFYADKPEQLKRLQQLKDIQLERDAIILEIHKRDEEYYKLAAYLENQPKAPTRKSYIERITEITKNSRKQDADIQQIIKDTRELQIESNSISERLHRIYAVVDETVFREAKSDPAKIDPVRKNVYRLLTSIHDSFKQIADTILLTDRTRRESADLEAKLAGLASRSADIDKLQADLDAIIKENEFLEQQRQRD